MTQEQIVKKSAPNWKLGLYYFGYTLIGIIPLSAFTNIMVQFGNYNYKLIIFSVYVIILPFWIKRTVVTASILFLRRYDVKNKNLVVLLTIIYFFAIWSILAFRINLPIQSMLIAAALEIYLLSWLTWYSLKYFQFNSDKK